MKVGGSLLKWNQLPRRLTRFLETIESPILLTGGGTATDVVRHWDDVHQLGEEASHALAIASVDLTARLLAQLLPQSQICTTPQSCVTLLEKKRLPILMPGDLLEELEPQSISKLPHHWETTSDSIALWLSSELGISNLILLKSVDVPEEMSWEQLSEHGIVDAEFPRLWNRLEFKPSIHCCNLRS